MEKNKNLLVLINIGSPTELSVPEVRKYLQRFLMDPHVIQIPYFLRFILFYLVICNIRAPKTFKKYQSIWTKQGSPFHVFTENFRRTLEAALNVRVLNMMMYSEPSFESGFAEIKAGNYSKITVCPMYPQYAESSTLASIEKFKSFFAAAKLTSEVEYVRPFYQMDFFIESFYRNIVAAQPAYQSFDHVVFSYHGLPQSHVARSSTADNYQQQCLNTTEKLAAKLKLEPKNYVTCFQSRVGLTKWIGPYLDQTCEALAQCGKKNLLLISPSFVVDGLETLQEIGDLEKSLQARFAVKLVLVPGLNSESHWVENFSEFIRLFFAE